MEVEKQGKVPTTQIKDGKLTGLTYDLKGLPGTEYEVSAFEDIQNPDGHSEAVYHKGDVIKTLTTGENGKATLDKGSKSS